MRGWCRRVSDEIDSENAPTRAAAQEDLPSPDPPTDRRTSEAIERKVDALLENAEFKEVLKDPEARREFEMRSEKLSIFFGPLPHPDTLVAYDAIESGLANRIVTMAEEQAHHDHEMESMSLTAGIRQSSRAQWLAFALALSVAVLACIVALFGAWWLGLFTSRVRPLSASLTTAARAMHSTRSSGYRCWTCRHQSTSA